MQAFNYIICSSQIGSGNIGKVYKIKKIVPPYDLKVAKIYEYDKNIQYENEKNILSKFTDNIRNDYIIKLKNDDVILENSDNFQNDSNLLVFDYLIHGKLCDYLYAMPDINFIKEDHAKILCYKILLGLKNCHEKNISHNKIDLKNIMLDNDFNPIIIHFSEASIITNNNFNKDFIMLGLKKKNYIEESIFWKKIEILFGIKISLEFKNFFDILVKSKNSLNVDDLLNNEWLKIIKTNQNEIEKDFKKEFKNIHDRIIDSKENVTYQIDITSMLNKPKDNIYNTLKECYINEEPELNYKKNNSKKYYYKINKESNFFNDFDEEKRDKYETKEEKNKYGKKAKKYDSDSDEEIKDKNKYKKKRLKRKRNVSNSDEEIEDKYKYAKKGVKCFDNEYDEEIEDKNEYKKKRVMSSDSASNEEIEDKNKYENKGAKISDSESYNKIEDKKHYKFNKKKENSNIDNYRDIEKEKKDYSFNENIIIKSIKSEPKEIQFNFIEINIDGDFNKSNKALKDFMSKLEKNIKVFNYEKNIVIETELSEINLGLKIMFEEYLQNYQEENNDEEIEYLDDDINNSDLVPLIMTIDLFKLQKEGNNLNNKYYLIFNQIQGDTATFYEYLNIIKNIVTSLLKF